MAKFWRRRGAVARATGFEQIDGPSGATWPPPRPRGVAWATILYVALSAMALATILGLVTVALLIARLSGGFDPQLLNYVMAHQIVFLGLGLAVLFGLVGSTYILHSWLRDHRPPAALGMAPVRPRAFVLWWGIAVLAVAPLILLTFFMSGQWNALPAALSGFAIAAPFFFIQASSEEIMFRGWMMQTIAARHGALIGLVASSLIFALGHIDPGETILGMIVGVAMRIPLGLALGVLALRYGSLWAGFGFHAGWNTAMFAGAVIATNKTGKSPWTEILAANSHTKLGDLANPDFLITLAIMLGVAAFIWWSSKDVRAKLFAPPSPERAEPVFQG